MDRSYRLSDQSTVKHRAPIGTDPHLPADGAGMALKLVSAETAKEFVASRRLVSHGEERPLSGKASQGTLLNLGTAGLIVAWLAVACYAIAYLIAH